MAKIRTTERSIRYNYFNILSVGYCNLQYLFSTTRTEPFAYTCGMYGWNADYYELRSESGRILCISTGYRPIGKSNQATNEIVERYDKKAEQLVYSEKAYKKKEALRNLYPANRENNYERDARYWKELDKIEKAEKRKLQKLLSDFTNEILQVFESGQLK